MVPQDVLNCYHDTVIIKYVNRVDMNFLMASGSL